MTFLIVEYEPAHTIMVQVDLSDICEFQVEILRKKNCLLIMVQVDLDHSCSIISDFIKRIVVKVDLIHSWHHELSRTVW